MTATAVQQPDRTVPVVLPDGRRIVIRRLTAADAPALVAAVERADPSDLRRRFMGSPPPTSLLVRQLRAADGVHDVVLGAFTEAGRLVAVAQFDRVDDAPSAELAIEVAHDWQHDHLGTALLTELAREARELGIHELTATYFADNFAIRHLLREVGRLTTTSYECGEGYASLDISDVRS